MRKRTRGTRRSMSSHNWFLFSKRKVTIARVLATSRTTPTHRVGVYHPPFLFRTGTLFEQQNVTTALSTGQFLDQGPLSPFVVPAGIQVLLSFIQVPHNLFFKANLWLAKPHNNLLFPYANGLLLMCSLGGFTSIRQLLPQCCSDFLMS